MESLNTLLKRILEKQAEVAFKIASRSSEDRQHFVACVHFSYLKL